MPVQSIFVRLTTFAAAALALSACRYDPVEEETASAEASDLPRGSYDIDRETGETNATFRNDDGSTTVMRSGKNVPVLLPEGFALYPGADVVNNTRVEQPDGAMVLLNMASRDAKDELVAFYREQAEAAGIEVDLDLSSGPMTMIGGKAADGTSFSFTATRENDLTEAQLSVGSGFK